MVKVKVGSAEVDHCDTCGAIWLDAGELRSLLANREWVETIDYGGERAPDPVILADAKVCPRDLTPLKESSDSKQAHVRTDKCPTCLGVLLDAGELKDLESFTVKERLRALIGK